MNTSPNSSWFYSLNNERKGPVPFSVLQDLLATKLPHSTLVWTEAMDGWVTASTIPELAKAKHTSSQDPNNPYAPPSTDPQSIEAAGSLNLGDIPTNPIPLDIVFCIKQAWNYTKNNLGNLFILGLVYFILSAIVPSALTGVATIVDEGGVLPFVADLIGQVFSLFLGMGALRYGHRLSIGEEPEVSELFSQGSKLLSAIGAYILFGIAFLLGLILLIIPGIYVGIRLGFFQQAIVEKNLGAFDSLKYSWELTKGNAMPLLGLYLLGILITIAGALALLVGLVWAIPTAWLSSIIAFRYLHGGPQTIKVID